MHLLSVNYHYFREEVLDHGIHSLTLKNLSDQIDTLSKYYSFISQDDLVRMICEKNDDKKKYCLLTFDDGLKEQMQALELLNKKGIPGIFYVNTGSIRYTTVATVHKLQHIRSIMQDGKIFDFINKYLDVNKVKYPENIDSLYRYDSLQTKKLKFMLNFYLDFQMKNRIIGDLFSELFDEENLSNQLYMSVDEIRKINRQNYLGTHGDMHLPFARLNNDDIKKDIQDSLDFLKKNCGVDKVKSISYPYGGPMAISNDVFEVSKSFGFDFGLTMTRGVNQINDLDHPLMLKRVDANDAPGGKFDNKSYCLK